MFAPLPPHRLIGGRLSLDFVNASTATSVLSWEGLISFLGTARIVSHERGTQLLTLPQSDPQAAEGLLLKARRLSGNTRLAFSAVMRKQTVVPKWIEPINEILQVTEGHDELVLGGGVWRIEFIAREAGLDWLLAAIARSSAEIIAEGASARVRLCANPNCALFFYDDSRTHRRRWCSMATCGNRSKVAAFARKRSASRHAP
ncbi:MAG TPA: CGNR zinc finger domain-containing protein [Candidatus Acidoferrum sp.]|nr:CGNR zinc finger domain-containing protein [Candidatus Acidoferrum sp.]